MSAPKPDQIAGRGIIGNELAAQATVDHYEKVVPWERMEREARKQGAPLCANLLASTCGKLIDLFDSVIDLLFKKVVTATYTTLDATSLPVLDIDHLLGIRTGTLWLRQGERVYSSESFERAAEA